MFYKIVNAAIKQPSVEKKLLRKISYLSYRYESRQYLGKH